MIFNDDIIWLINQNNDVITCFNFICSDKNNFKICKTQLENLIKKKKKYLINIYPSVIFELINGISTLIFAPILKYKSYFGGDYIDCIKPNDMSSPIMFGIDFYRRPFISIRTYKHDQISVTTIFQRYTDDNSLWTHGVYTNSHILSDYDIPRIILRNEIQVKDDPYIKINIHHLINNSGYVLQKDYGTETYIKVPARLI